MVDLKRIDNRFSGLEGSSRQEDTAAVHMLASRKLQGSKFLALKQGSGIADVASSTVTKISRPIVFVASILQLQGHCTAGFRLQALHLG